MKLPDAILEPLRRIDLERLAGLRPAYPPVAVEINRREMILVRFRVRRGKEPVLEAHGARPLSVQAGAGSVLHPILAPPEEAATRFRELLEVTGTRPARISLVLPDGLARVSLMSFPERPPSRKHLLEMIRFKLRRAVPFRLEDTVLSYQILPGSGPGLRLLVALMLRSTVEQYERAIEAAGAKVGLVEIATHSLFNLCRADLARAGAGGRDVALLNCTPGYFSLMIARGSLPIFYRCKSHGAGESEAGGDGGFSRELVTSLSYYQERLGGESIGATFVRTVAMPFEPLRDLLGRLGFGDVLRIDVAKCLGGSSPAGLDEDLWQRIAPAAGAAAGRGR